MSGGSQRIIACPRCKARQPVRPICENCGFDIKAHVFAQHRARQEQARPYPSAGAGEPVGGDRSGGLPQREVIEGSVEWLFGTTWEIYKRRWLLLLGVIVGGTLAAMACFGIFMGIWYLAALLMPFPSTVKWILAGIGVVAGAGLGTALWGWCMGAMFEASADERVMFSEAFGIARRKLWAYVWLLSLSGFMILGGYLLFLIPGVIFTVWFWYAPYVLAVEGAHGMKAMIRSREYVRGRWWGTFVQLLLLLLCQMAVNIIPIAGVILAIAFIPFTMIYVGQAYRYGKRIHPEAEWHAPTAGEKFRYVALGSAGYVVAILLAVWLISGAVKNSGFSMKNLLERFKPVKIEVLNHGEDRQAGSDLSLITMIARSPIM